jgi:hypothetical protein
MKRSRGVTLVEILISLPLMLAVSWAVVSVMFLCTEVFERSEFYARSTSWQSAERLLAFLDGHLKHSGIGLPERWDSDLFSPFIGLDLMPKWSFWKKTVSVGNSVSGRSFVSTGTHWGNTVRIVSAVPTGQVLVKPLVLENARMAKMYLSDSVKNAPSVDPISSTSWLLFPGTEVPVRLASGAATSVPGVAARRDTEIPWGEPVCRLMALLIYAEDGTVYGDFCDGSGTQPLFRSIDQVLFRIDPMGKLLTVKILLRQDHDKNPLEVSRTWKIGL